MQPNSEFYRPLTQSDLRWLLDLRNPAPCCLTAACPRSFTQRARTPRRGETLGWSWLMTSGALTGSTPGTRSRPAVASSTGRWWSPSTGRQPWTGSAGTAWAWRRVSSGSTRWSGETAPTSATPGPVWSPSSPANRSPTTLTAIRCSITCSRYWHQMMWPSNVIVIMFRALRSWSWMESRTGWRSGNVWASPACVHTASTMTRRSSASSSGATSPAKTRWDRME